MKLIGWHSLDCRPFVIYPERKLGNQKMTIDLSTLSRKELVQLRANIDREIERAAVRELQAAREAAEKAAQEFGFSLNDLQNTPKGKTKTAARFRNPNDADQTWSGRGRKPQWIKDAEAAGTDISAFAI